MAAAKPLVVAIAFLLVAAAAIPLPTDGGGDIPPPYTVLPAEPPTVSLPDGGGKVPPYTLLSADPAATGCRGSVGMCPERGKAPPGLGTAAGGISTMSVDEEPVRRRVHHQKRDSVPCSRRGASYYNCRSGAQDSPYRRACSRIKNCHG